MGIRCYGVCQVYNSQNYSVAIIIFENPLQRVSFIYQRVADGQPHGILCGNKTRNDGNKDHQPQPDQTTRDGENVIQRRSHQGHSQRITKENCKWNRKWNRNRPTYNTNNQTFRSSLCDKVIIVNISHGAKSTWTNSDHSPVMVRVADPHSNNRTRLEVHVKIEGI